MEYNSQLPYSVVKSDDFDYRFITKNGITSASIASPLSRLSVPATSAALGIAFKPALCSALVGTSFHLAARDSGQRPQSFLSLAERSDSKVMSMHKALSVKSRVRGDFHARFCERVRVKLPRSTRP
ncbi:MAG: hypothetical protein MR627_06420 [Prevotella sp.]|nr:hypothetical protein [Prevotella sp.]